LGKAFFGKEEFMKIYSLLFTSLLLLSTWASTADSDAIPGWAREVFSRKLAARYRYFNALHPSHLEADFNGDKKQDVAVLIRNKSSGKIGIAIILRDKGVTILGAGTLEMAETTSTGWTDGPSAKRGTSTAKSAEVHQLLSETRFFSKKWIQPAR